MDLSEFEFELPEELIALRPATPRTASRLLVSDGMAFRDRKVSDLPDLLRAGDRLVMNNSKVIPALLSGTRIRAAAGGGDLHKASVSLVLVREVDEAKWVALAKPAKRLKPGDLLRFGAGLTATVETRDGPECMIAFDLRSADLIDALEKAGSIPLPAYISRRRPPDTRDRTDYQTVFASRPGAVAAPTAALHFDDELLAELRAKGIGITFLTLHVGPGTFLPVKSRNIEEHAPQAEWGEVSEEAADEINSTRKGGGRIIPVGTTSLRLLEAASVSDGEVRPWRGLTDIFIRPGHQFNVADGLMTNFHLPGSSLVILVSALVGVERMKEIYAHAIARQYRFYSYGDSSLLLNCAGIGN